MSHLGRILDGDSVRIRTMITVLFTYFKPSLKFIEMSGDFAGSFSQGEFLVFVLFLKRAQNPVDFVELGLR